MYDLPIALGILAADGKLECATLDDYLIAGELSLSGATRPVKGGLALAVLAAPVAIARSVLGNLLLRPARFLRALATTLAMSRTSDRGLLRHLAYLAEACRVRDRLVESGREHLHVHFGTNFAAVGRLARLLGGPPFSVTMHGPDEFDAPVALSLA